MMSRNTFPEPQADSASYTRPALQCRLFSLILTYPNASRLYQRLQALPPQLMDPIQIVKFSWSDENPDLKGLKNLHDWSASDGDVK